MSSLDSDAGAEGGHGKWHWAVDTESVQVYIESMDDGLTIDTGLGTPHTVAFMVANPAIRAQVKGLVATITTKIELKGEWVFNNNFNWRAQKTVVTAVRWMVANKLVVTSGPDYRPTLRAV